MAKREYVYGVTPVGLLSYPCLYQPDTGEYNTGLYHTGLYLTESDLKSPEGQEFVKSVLLVLRTTFKDDTITFSNRKGFNIPIKKLSDLEPEKFQALPDILQQGNWYEIKIKSPKSKEKGRVAIRPTFVHRDGKLKLSDDELKAIEGGDAARAKVIINSYDGPLGAGVSFWPVGFQLVEKNRATFRGSVTFESVDQPQDDGLFN